jgi:hypothetical protein
MSDKVIRCVRCRKRQRSPEGWNVDYVAGLVIGYVCANCQSAEEDLGAQVNLVLSPPSGWSALNVAAEGERGIRQLVDALTRTYPTPGTMRARAEQLVAARRDEQASEMARLMRWLADDMEADELA